MATEADLAYAAGIIDGEGCISINQPRNRGFFSLHVEVSMSSKEPIEFLKQCFGGNIGLHTKTSGYRDMWRWTLQSEKAQEFLKLIQPYIKGKSDQVICALDFPVGSKNGIQLYGYGKEIPEDILELRYLCYDKMKELKMSPNGKIKGGVQWQAA